MHFQSIPTNVNAVQMKMPWAPAKPAEAESGPSKTSQRHDKVAQHLAHSKQPPQLYVKVGGTQEEWDLVRGMGTFATLGLITGMGPDAGVDLEQKIITSAQKMRPPSGDQENVNIINFNMPNLVKDRTAYFNRVDKSKVSPEEWDAHLRAKDPDNPLWGVLAKCRLAVACGAHALVIACNTEHIQWHILQEKIPVPILHIVDGAMYGLKKANPDAKKIGLLATDGTINNGLYPERAAEKYPEVEWVYPTELSQKRDIMGGIYDGVKKGDLARGTQLLTVGAYLLIEKQKPDAVLQSCTEIPPALKGLSFDAVMVDSTEGLAEYAAKFAMDAADAHWKQQKELEGSASTETAKFLARMKAPEEV